jgi:hypothetical protein|tara:strand:- start:1119 stop:2135 length:1017 start_codon:yes stop_codon:yes gene_type:complete
MADRPLRFGSAKEDAYRRAFGINSAAQQIRFGQQDLHLNDNIGLNFGTDDDAEIMFDGTNLLLGTSATTVFGTGAAEAVLQSSGDQDLLLQTGNSTTNTIRITDGNNANITMTTQGTGDIVLASTEVVVGDGAAEAVVESSGNFDLLLQTGNTTTPTIRLTDGNNANITLTPTGTGDVALVTGEVVVGDGAAEAVVESSGNFDLLLQTGNTTTPTIRVTDGDNAAITLTPTGTGKVSLALPHVTPSTQALTDTGATDLITSITEYTTTGVATSTLADGTEGQHKYLVVVVYVGDQVLTPTNLAGGSTITFSAVGDSAHLLFTGGSWHVVGSNGITIGA